jgi:hypothetical protein
VDQAGLQRVSLPNTRLTCLGCYRHFFALESDFWGQRSVGVSGMLPLLHFQLMGLLAHVSTLQKLAERASNNQFAGSSQSA